MFLKRPLAPHFLHLKSGRPHAASCFEGLRRIKVFFFFFFNIYLR